MKTKHYLIGLLYLYNLAAVAQQNSYSIKLTIKGLQSQKYYLSHYFGASQYLVKDTAQADTSGIILFEGTQSLPEGLYFVKLPQDRRLEFIFVNTEASFSIITDTTDLVGNAKIEGSPENLAYYASLKYIQSQQHQIDLLQAMNGGQDISNLVMQQRIRTIRNETFSYLNRLAKAYPGMLAGKYIKASTEPPLPMPPMYANGGYDTAFVARATRKHFFDNIDFSDDRLVRSPWLEQRLRRFFDRSVVPHLDSIKASCDRIATLANANPEVYRFSVYIMSNYFETSKVIGGDAVFVHLAEEYYLKNKVPVDSSVIKNLKERVSTLKPLLIGQPMPPINLIDPNGQIRKLYDMPQGLVFVVFYDPLCSKCRQKMPLLVNFYQKYKADGIGIYAVNVERIESLWKDMMDQMKFRNLWVNVWDKHAKVDFRKDFDIYGTPVIYVLDNTKHIVLKKLEVEQLESVVQLFKQSQQASNAVKK